MSKLEGERVRLDYNEIKTHVNKVVVAAYPKVIPKSLARLAQDLLEFADKTENGLYVIKEEELTPCIKFLNNLPMIVVRMYVRDVGLTCTGRYTRECTSVRLKEIKGTLVGWCFADSYWDETGGCSEKWCYVIPLIDEGQTTVKITLQWIVDEYSVNLINQCSPDADVERIKNSYILEGSIKFKLV